MSLFNRNFWGIVLNGKWVKLSNGYVFLWILFTMVFYYLLLGREMREKLVKVVRWVLVRLNY